jgi:hypothetical protein
MSETLTKFRMSLDFKRVEQQRKLEEKAKKEEERKAKQAELSNREEFKKS